LKSSDRRLQCSNVLIACVSALNVTDTTLASDHLIGLKNRIETESSDNAK
jgi:hypothetical protein